MTGVKTVIFVSLAASISFTFLLLACALPQYNVWWPLFMLIFYIIAPVPLLLAKNCQNSSSSEDLSVFLTTVIVTSAYALPILFARAPKNNPLVSLAKRNHLSILDILGRLWTYAVSKHTYVCNHLFSGLFGSEA
ncbi:Leptin receptor overlapping transcript-like 1 isoform 1 [Schistosoma japonicum]|uniref:Leptin receptor overlapping transcript-like 1 isoform 1 n=1 Tax=Schistosoma japonicum TaxID=6182 RepID=A0A4Z2CXU2_SCHJA|nr:Leptin receptor overlapping transcript-like 1 isoform 1 [Schistosoma japonicum]